MGQVVEFPGNDSQKVFKMVPATVHFLPYPPRPVYVGMDMASEPDREVWCRVEFGPLGPIVTGIYDHRPDFEV